VPYPRRLLNEGEELALDLRPHWWYFAKQVITGFVLFVVFAFVVGLDDGGFKDVAWWVWGLAALAWAAWLAYHLLQWMFTYFVVTNERVIYRHGVVARTGVEIPLERINNINFHQPFWERIIGAGDLEIESAGQDGESRFEDVWHPDGVQQEIYRQIKTSSQRRAQWSGAAPARVVADPGPTPIPEQIRQLAELRDRGAITDAEFEAKKAELLRRM
jgi:uncharacterized membrane protein YdbT with pleckstrin-like domain